MGERGHAILGGVAILLVVAVVYGIFLALAGAFIPGYDVSATFSRAGQLLRGGSDVKMRGVLVGIVTDVDVDEVGQAHVMMRIQPDHEIPANVIPAIRAKTLFGEKFIDLVIPEEPTEHLLAPGDDIPVEQTIPPMEVETVLERGLPILEAVDPGAFAGALHALARGLVGNEEALRRATLQSERLLTETERTLPNLERNLVHLRNFAAALDEVDTDFLDALDGLAAVGEAIRSRPEEFRRTLSSLLSLSRDVADLLTDRERDLAVIAGQGRPILEAVAERADELPGIVRTLDTFLAVWVANLSEGPHWRITAADPVIVLGEPYAPGEAPAPRQAAMSRLVPSEGKGGIADVLDILLAPVPTQELERAVEGLEGIIGGLLR